MPKKVSARIQDHFAPLTDPRRRKVIYPLINVVMSRRLGSLPFEADSTLPTDASFSQRWNARQALTSVLATTDGLKELDDGLRPRGQRVP